MPLHKPTHTQTDTTTTAAARNRVYFLWHLNGTKRSSRYFLRYRSPITWYRQVQRQIVWFQCGKSPFFFTSIWTKHSIFWKTCCSFLKNAENLIFATPSEGSGFFKSGMFRMIAYCRPMISPWSPCDYRRQNEKHFVLVNCFRFFKNKKIVKNVKTCIEKM